MASMSGGVSHEAAHDLYNRLLGAVLPIELGDVSWKYIGENGCIDALLEHRPSIKKELVT